MSNVSGWKNFERQIAKALGGKRRLRTMESFGKSATDVYFSRSSCRSYPKLRGLMVECKKRRGVNVHGSFVEAKLKYVTKPGQRLILASVIPATKKGNMKWKRLRDKLNSRLGKRLKRRDFIAPLVTVELDFFKELFQAWLYGSGESK